MRCGFDTFWRWVQVLGQKKVSQIENIVMTLAFSLCNKWTQVRKEKLRQDGQRKKSKTGCDSERKSFINFISSFTASSCVPTPHQKSIWREPAYLPQPQITKAEAEAERTHTKHMDIVKKEKSIKGQKHSLQRDRVEDSETRWALDYSARTAPRKRCCSERRFQILRRCVRLERNGRRREWEDIQRQRRGWDREAGRLGLSNNSC